MLQNPQCVKMRVIYHLFVLVCLLNIFTICKQEDKLFTEDVNSDGGFEPTAAEQYIDFITSAPQASEDLVDDDSVEAQHEDDEKVFGNDDDYGLESLTALLSKFFVEDSLMYSLITILL